MICIFYFCFYLPPQREKPLLLCIEQLVFRLLLRSYHYCWHSLVQPQVCNRLKEIAIKCLFLGHDDVAIIRLELTIIKPRAVLQPAQYRSAHAMCCASKWFTGFKTNERILLIVSKCLLVVIVQLPHGHIDRPLFPKILNSTALPGPGDHEDINARLEEDISRMKGNVQSKHKIEGSEHNDLIARYLTFAVDK